MIQTVTDRGTIKQYSVVHEFELSRHAEHGITCLDCHHPAAAQHGEERHGFTMVTRLTLAQLTRSDLSAVLAQPACGGLAGPGVRRTGAEAQTGDLRGALSTRLREASSASTRRQRRCGLRELPQYRSAERRWDHRQLHGVSHAAHQLGGHCPAEDDLWPVSSEP
jgi:hypothetical protein